MTVNSPTRLSKKDVLAELHAFGYTDDQLVDKDGKKLKRAELVEKLQEHKQGEAANSSLIDVEEDDDDIGIEIAQDVKEEAEEAEDDTETDTLREVFEEVEPPTQDSPEWTQYVLGKFMTDEMDNKNPRVEGLRRVSQMLIGELLEEGCDLLAVPTEENRFRACAKAWCVFLTPMGREKRFEALADAHPGNCLEDFATYLVAMAETRAKGRMYRNALCLRRVVAAEEVSKTVAAVAEVQPGGAIHEGQVTLIRMMSDRHNFPIIEVLDSLDIPYKLNEQTGDVNLQSLNYEDALAAAKRMREMKEEKESK